MGDTRRFTSRSWHTYSACGTSITITCKLSLVSYFWILIWYYSVLLHIYVTDPNHTHKEKEGGHEEKTAYQWRRGWGWYTHYLDIFWLAFRIDRIRKKYLQNINNYLCKLDNNKKQLFISGQKVYSIQFCFLLQ